MNRRHRTDLVIGVAIFLALLGYLWFLAIPLPWSGVPLLVAIAAAWRGRSLTLRQLGLGWDDFRASGRRWRVIWVLSVSSFVLLGRQRLLGSSVFLYGTVYFAWAAVQQVAYQSMIYVPLRENLNRRWVAAGLAGIAFSALHVPNPILVPATYVWGVASSILFERCRSIWGLALLQTLFASALFWRHAGRAEP